jgi:hypothetical protein
MTAGSAVGPARTSVPPQAPGPGAPQPGWPPRLSPRLLASLLPSVLASIIAPALAYTLIRPHVASSATALLAAVAIPAGWTLATVAWRRRASRLGLVSVAVSVIALAVSYLMAGSALALELQDPAETGALGLACLVSVIARRPLWLMALRLAARRNAQAARMLAGPAIGRRAMAETTIIGALLLIHAIAITVLALTLPTGTFLAVSRQVGLPIIAAGLAVLIGYRRRQRSKTGHDVTPRAGGSDDDQPS